MPGSPVLGSLPELRGNWLTGFQNIAADYPEVAEFDLPGHRCALVSSPALTEAIWRNNDQVKKHWVTGLVGYLTGNGLFTLEGQIWGLHQRMVKPSLTREAIETYDRTMHSRTVRALCDWPEGSPVDARQLMGRLTLGIVGESLCGIDLQADAGAIVDALYTALACTQRRLKGLEGLGLPIWVPTPNSLRLRQAVA